MVDALPEFYAARLPAYTAILDQLAREEGERQQRVADAQGTASW